MADENSPITVRPPAEMRPALQKFAKLLRVSEGKVLQMCFEDIAELVEQRGRETLPQTVYLLRAALEFEDSKPSLALRKLDERLYRAYASGEISVPNAAPAAETPLQRKKRGQKR